MSDLLKAAPLRAAAAEASKLSIEQQKLVLRYPDIAARLCQPPLRYRAPGEWTGYIPPARCPEAVNGTVPLNMSPIRAALMGILEAAAERYDAEHRGAA